MTASKLSRIALLLLIVGGAMGCRKQPSKDEKSGAAPAASSSAAVIIPAKGDTGIVEGFVTMEGDPAAVQPNLSARVPKDCQEALKVYELIFREGPARRVADVFVGVTGYQGAPGAKRGPVSVLANGCAWNKRTFGLTTEQHLTVRSMDKHPYVPALYGTKVGAALVAVPGGDVVPVYPKGPGMYLLVDEMRNFIQATVLVVKFPTFDVTDLDGKFRIEGVPVGNVDVSAFLPTVNLKAEQKVTVSKNATTRVNLTLRFDASAYVASTYAAAATSASAEPPPVAAPAPAALSGAQLP